MLTFWIKLSEPEQNAALDNRVPVSPSGKRRDQSCVALYGGGRDSNAFLIHPIEIAACHFLSSLY
jgi:hypothetical protein